MDELSIEDVVAIVTKSGLSHQTLLSVNPNMIRDFPLQGMWEEALKMLNEIQEYLDSGG